MEFFRKEREYDFPLGIWRYILLRLPAESLFRLRSVSKGWRTTIDDPSFVKAHTQNQQASSNTTLLIRNTAGPPFYPLYLVDLQALDFTVCAPQTIPATPLKLTPSALSTLPPLPTASCNGLFLVSPMTSDSWGRRRRQIDFEDGNHGIWEILNLLTHERLELPQLNIKGQVSGYGFGYDSVSDDYKVVLIELDTRQTHVYSLRLNSWRMIGKSPFHSKIRVGVFLNGALHFVSYCLRIFALDVATERYRTPALKLPAVVAENKPSDMQLAALGGVLFLSFHIGKYDVEDYEGWVMNCYGAEGLWVKLFSLRKDARLSGLRPVAYEKDHKWVLLHHPDNGFLWLDVDGNSGRRVGVHGFFWFLSAQVFVGSLFRLRGSCGSAAGDKPRVRNRVADTRLTFCVKDYAREDTCSPVYVGDEACFCQFKLYNWLY